MNLALFHTTLSKLQGEKTMTLPSLNYKWRAIMKLPGITLIFSLFAFLFVFNSILLPAAEETIETLSIRLEAAKKKEGEIEGNVVNKIYDIKKVVENYSTSESELKGLNGLGRIEQLELKAQRYGIERQARKILEKEIMELLDIIKDWENNKKEMAEIKKYLELKQQIFNLENNVKQDKVNMSLTKDSIEYYEVKKEATLKEISALPDVYGNAASWKFLFDANKDVIKDPTKAVPVGTVLIVPNVKTEEEFKGLE